MLLLLSLLLIVTYVITAIIIIIVIIISLLESQSRGHLSSKILLGFQLTVGIPAMNKFAHASSFTWGPYKASLAFRGGTLFHYFLPLVSCILFLAHSHFKPTNHSFKLENLGLSSFLFVNLGLFLLLMGVCSRFTSFCFMNEVWNSF